MAACAGALFFLPAAAPVQAGHYFEYDDDIQGLTLNPSPLYPRYVTVEWKDGRRVLLYRRLPPARRKESVPHYRRVPYSEMARARVPPDRYGLYLAELARDYRAIGFQPRPPQTGVPRLIYRTGGVHPATSQPVSPVKRK